MVRGGGETTNKLQKLGIVTIAAAIAAVSLGAIFVNAAPQGVYAYKYTTGPLRSPSGTLHIDWMVLNNAPTTQTVRVTIYELSVAPDTTKTIMTAYGGPYEITLASGQTTHNAGGTFANHNFEIVVETNSKLVFPSADFWDYGQSSIPGSEITSAEFIRQMP